MFLQLNKKLSILNILLSHLKIKLFHRKKTFFEVKQTLSVLNIMLHHSNWALFSRKIKLLKCNILLFKSKNDAIDVKLPLVSLHKQTTIPKADLSTIGCQTDLQNRRHIRNLAAQVLAGFLNLF